MTKHLLMHGISLCSAKYQYARMFYIMQRVTLQSPSFPLVSPFPPAYLGHFQVNQFSSCNETIKKKRGENANPNSGDVRRLRGNDGGFCALPASINSHLGNTATQANSINRIFVKSAVNRTLSHVMRFLLSIDCIILNTSQRANF
jgi:hypothetical protein